MPKLIAQMITYNESGRHLRRVLDRLSKQVDEIVVTDDASRDDTVEIAREYTPNVYQMEENTFTKNEGLLRQTAWYNLENHATTGDWILCIDADEEFYPIKGYENLLTQQGYRVLGVKFYHLWNETHYRVDKAWVPNISSRLFRYEPGGVFRDRKLACGSEPTYVSNYVNRGKFMPHSGLKMLHLGYLRDEDKKAKYERYSKLDGGKFHANAHIESIMDPNPTLVEWEVLDG